MKITDFKDLIKNMPSQLHAFDIQRDHWKNAGHNEFLDRIFASSEIVAISRADLYNETDIQLFVLKTLMWGYPTMGRGNNIKNLLSPPNFEKLYDFLNEIRGNEIEWKDSEQFVKEMHGLGLSTFSKFTCFLKCTIEGNHAIILDNQLIEAINTERFEELNTLKGIKYDNALDLYPKFVSIIGELAQEMDVCSEQIEMFLFVFGRNLLQK